MHTVQSSPTQSYHCLACNLAFSLSATLMYSPLPLTSPICFCISFCHLLLCPVSFFSFLYMYTFVFGLQSSVQPAPAACCNKKAAAGCSHYCPKHNMEFSDMAIATQLTTKSPDITVGDMSKPPCILGKPRTRLDQLNGGQKFPIFKGTIMYLNDQKW